MDVDGALSNLGRCGKWQIVFYNIICVSSTFAGAWHMLSIVFLGADVEHRCQLPDALPVNGSIPFETKKDITRPSQCFVYTNFSAEINTTESCPDGWYFEEGQRWTIRQEWNLVCKKSYLVETSQTVLVLGVMVGAISCSALSDAFGRKQIFIVSELAIAAAGIITAFVHNIYAFIFLRFVTGFFQQGCVLVGFVLACEMFPAEVRTDAGMLIMNWWAVGMCVLAGIAYLEPSWHNLMLIVSVPGLLNIVFIWVLPQSIPWLVAKGRILQAKLVLRGAAKFNGVTLPEQFQLTEKDLQKLKEKKNKKKDDAENHATDHEMAEVNGKKDEKGMKEGVDKRKGSVDGEDHAPVPGWIRRASTKFVEQFELKAKDGTEYKYTIMDVFRSRRLRMYTIVMCYLWMVDSLVYYGLSLSTGNLAGGLYLNFFLSGLVEIPAYITAMFVLKYIGRRWPICIFHIVAGVALLLTLVTPEKTASGVNLVPLIMTFGMVGKFGITASFGSLFLYATEIYPTTIRNVGMGLASVLGRIGNLLAPFSAYLAKLIWWFPGVVFGAMCVLAGILTLILPETRNKPLPQTIADVENFKRK